MINIICILGFVFATYACFSNDVIQSLGTFLNVNSKKNRLVLWGFISTIAILTFLYGYFIIDDIAFGRLDELSEITNPNWWYIIPPLSLIIMSKVGITASTTFLILSVFASNLVIQDMIIKSILGYGLAFGLSIIIYKLISKYEKKFIKTRPHKIWHLVFWISTIFLFVSWITQNSSSMYVFLPRDITIIEMLISLLVIILSLGILVYQRGGKLQYLIRSKTNSTDIRSSSIINILFGLVLFICLYISSTPLSTTWTFLGTLAGRELIIGKYKKRTYKDIFKIIGYDFMILIMGLVISVCIAKLIVNI